jgi:N-acetylmuramoyl-L-alanine amidase
MKHRFLAAIVTAASLLCASPARAADTPRDMYNRALAQERQLRDDAMTPKPTAVQMRRLVASYESIVRRHPASGYCDNALWQAANVAALTYERFGNEVDRRTAARLFTLLANEYPTSKLVARANEAMNGLNAPATPPAPAPVTAAAAPAAPSRPRPVPAWVSDPDTSAPVKPVAEQRAPRTDPGAPALLKEIRRTVLPDGIRLTVDLDSEVSYHQEEIANPRRVFFDLKGVKATPALQDVSLKFDGDVVKEVRLGRHPQNTTRLVVDLDGVSSYTVYPLYGPYRLVMDFRRAVATTTPAAPNPPAAPIIVPPVAMPARTTATINTLPQIKLADPRPSTQPDPPVLASIPAVPKSLPPAAPDANSNGKFSLSRQLGLSVSRVVIDAGHGGHDPGAHGNGINESELTLDVAMRVQKLLEKQPGIEVVMTRDTDVFIALEERTAIANREGADLFLSIHANASRNAAARGIETYFLNFAMNPEAEAVAARENATSGRAMHSLPDIVRAIALNNKINESRDLAATVQKAMAKRLAAKNRSLKDLGVKQAPFVVLIGAVMPSVLAEISFVTNKQDGALLKTPAYRQQIAQSLFDGIVNYQQGLKRMNAVAGKKATSQH